MGKVNIILVIVGVTLVGLVLGLSSYNEPASAGLPTEVPCDFSAVQQHWDKIIFKTDQRLFNDSPPPLFPPILYPRITYDIKVEQDPVSATNLELTVSSFLTAKNYKTFDGKAVLPKFISIVDVEYSIVCTVPTSPPVVVDKDGDGYTTDGTGLGFDCDDTDASVNPGATEVLNGIDDDCDGLIDEPNGATDGGAMSNYLPLSINSLGFK